MSKGVELYHYRVDVSKDNKLTSL